MMIEVFKTNVLDPGQASMLVKQIHQNFRNYKANFDLEDCDKILRVYTPNNLIQVSRLIMLLKENGYEAEVLPED